MPQIKIMHVVSFSSEDKVYKAENLLNLDTYRKWKCATTGEKQVSVILQFEKASVIHSIDIGNEGSAFVEVLVSRSSDASSDFQVLLVASSFMSPLESRQGSNINRVRMFGPEKLSQTLIKEKWDRVKLVCTQPFNKNIQYGLSFVKFHSPDTGTTECEDDHEKKDVPLLGAFKLKPDIENDELSIGNLFARRNETKDTDPITGPVAIRAASSLASAVLSSAKNNLKVISKDQSSVWKKKESEEISYDVSSKKRDSLSPKNITKDLKQANNYKNAVTSTKEQRKRTHSDNKQSVKKIKGNKTEKPFKKLMEQVIFVLSGFQNPFRTELRDKALEMGAKYKADWDSTCTHLVCAFSNTPKYNQVFAKGGRIVTKEWILDCHKMKQLLPCRKYMLGNSSKETSSESENEEKEVVSSPQLSHASSAGSLKGSSSPVKNKFIEKYETDQEDSDELYLASTDVDSTDSDRDTEDELRRAEKQAFTFKDSSKNAQSPKGDNSLENRSNNKDNLLPELPDFFINKHFFLYGDFTAVERRTLHRCIIAYAGTLHDYMDDKVKYIVTRSAWDNNFNEALNDNENIVFVKPEWIYKCDEMHKSMPYQPFVIAPNG